MQTFGRGTPLEMVKAQALRLARQQLPTLRGLASARWSGQRINNTSLQHRPLPPLSLPHIVATLLLALRTANTMTISRREHASMNPSMPRIMATTKIKKHLRSGGITTYRHHQQRHGNSRQVQLRWLLQLCWSAEKRRQSLLSSSGEYRSMKLKLLNTRYCTACLAYCSVLAFPQASDKPQCQGAYMSSLQKVGS